MSTPPDTDLGSGLATVRSAVDEADAVGFLQVDRGRTPSRRYLTRQQGPDRETAVLFCPGDDSHLPAVIYCVPSNATNGVELPTAHDSVDWQIAGRPPTAATGQQLQAILADQLGEPGDQPLLVPRDLPHDTAVFLQGAGYELQSTAAVRTARATKTDAERDCLTAVQQAAADGMARAEAVLAASDHGDGGVTFESRPLTAEQLRREINAELALRGVSPAGNTRIEAPTAESTDQLPRSDPICLRLAPQAPHGYHAHLTRTFVVDSDGGWERRASVAVEAGLRAAARHIEPGVDVSTVEGEIIAEIGAYGFAVGPETEADQRTRRDQPAWATAAVHGVGLSTHERPAPGTDSTLQEDAVIAVEAGVVDPTGRAIRLGTLRAVTDEESVRLAPYPSSLTPADRRASADPNRE